MKKIGFLALVSLFFWRCGDDGNLVGFELTYVQDFQIFAGLNTFQTHVFNLEQIRSEYEAFLGASDFSDSDVIRIIPKLFRLTSISGNIPFSDLERVRIFIVKPDGSFESEVAFLEPVPLSAGFELDLAPTLANVEEHIREERFNILVKLDFRTTNLQSIDARLNFTFQAVTEE